VLASGISLKHPFHFLIDTLSALLLPTNKRVMILRGYYVPERLDWKPMGSRPVGRPRQRWQEDVMEDLKKLKAKNLKEVVKDRRTWRDLAEKAKTHKVF
jgi:hypothetical protein